ncbi:MAG: hypothetical protein R2710_18765 [Acidimicrobiales bacterium]
MRRATTLLALLEADAAAADLTDLTRRGVEQAKTVERLPPGPKRSATTCGPSLASIKDLPSAEQRAKLIETGYVMPLARALRARRQRVERW